MIQCCDIHQVLRGVHSVEEGWGLERFGGKRLPPKQKLFPLKFQKMSLQKGRKYHFKATSFPFPPPPPTHTHTQNLVQSRSHVLLMYDGLPLFPMGLSFFKTEMINKDKSSTSRHVRHICFLKLKSAHNETSL